GKSILWCTIIGLSLNVYLKFLHPIITGITLSRAEEMLAGAIIPMVLLGAYEILVASRSKISTDYLRYKRSHAERLAKNINLEDTEDSQEQNNFGLRVLARTMGVTAFIFIILAILASDKALWITLSVGIVIGLTSWMIYNKLPKS